MTSRTGCWPSWPSRSTRSLSGADPESPSRELHAELRREVARLSEAAGFYRLSIPASDGGLGAGALTLTAAREALACSGNPFAGLILARGAGIMRLADNDAQREELYAPVLAGQRSAAFGFTEAPGAQRTQAVPCTLEGGEPGFAVTGRKAFVTGGDSADWIVVVANVPPNMHAEAEAGGTALLVVDRDARGVEQGEVGASIDGATHCPFSFSETPVPESRLLGRIGDGLPRALANIDQMRLSVAASAVGYSRWANRATLKRIEGPHRSGTALAEREQVQAIFADNVTETYIARATLYGAARALELGVPSASTAGGDRQVDRDRDARARRGSLDPAARCAGAASRACAGASAADRALAADCRRARPSYCVS